MADTAIAERLDKALLVELFRQMLLIRRFEEKSAEMYARGHIGGFLHLYIGEEAVAVGAVSAMQPQDYIVSHYRDHGYALARGSPPGRVMAELFGKATGLSRGKGGSMHLFDVPRGMWGGYAIVAGHVPLAVGLALAAKRKREDRAVVCFLGDGAINQGVFFEAMNMASLWKLPVLFFIENNGYGMGTAVERAFAGKDIYRIGQAHNVPGQQVDGMQVLEVRRATAEALDQIRSGGGPRILEALTFRFRGHSMADPELYRSKEETARWMERDPIVLHRRYLGEQGLLSQEETDALEREVEATVAEAVRFAQESPDPAPETLYQNVYLD